jgi:energy-coupling factor transport system ATP-binding protein
MPIIIDKVSHVYGEDTDMAVKALDNINLVIPDGQFIGLIGHTGSGKSTLVQHLNGLMKATSGNIYFNGEDIDSEGFNKKYLRSKVGLVFKYPEHQLFEMDVFTDVCFGPKNLGLSKKEAELRAYEALKLVGVEDEYFYQSPFELSGGQKRRVAIAGVLAMKPDVLILDEPTAGLDPKGRDEILDQISKLKRETGITVILVSHSMDDVAKYVDRIIVMNKGRVMYDDVPHEIFKHYVELEKIGLSAPQVTYIMKDLKDHGYDIGTDATTIEEAKNEIKDYFTRLAKAKSKGR